jgi:hypothetical protein
MHRDLGRSNGCVFRRALCCGRRAVTSAYGLGFTLRIQRPLAKTWLGATARRSCRILEVPVPSPRGANPDVASKEPKRTSTGACTPSAGRRSKQVGALLGRILAALTAALPSQ